MDLRLQGEVAVIVGAAQGIGRAIALAFQREGASVVVIDREEAVMLLALEMNTLESYQSHTVQALGLVVDVTDYEAMRHAAQSVDVTFGHCDHVVYAVGVGSGKYGFPFWNLEPSDWPRVLNVNLLGAVHTAHAFAPGMAESCKGTLLFLSSIAGQIGSQTDPPYSAAKAALINFAQCAAKDLAPHNVRVNTLCPGMIKTGLNQSTWMAWSDRQPEADKMTYAAWAEDKIRRVTPLNRWQEPEDVAAMAVFLASSQAKNITGQTINVDGGQVMHW